MHALAARALLEWEALLRDVCSRMHGPYVSLPFIKVPELVSPGVFGIMLHQVTALEGEVGAIRALCWTGTDAGGAHEGITADDSTTSPAVSGDTVAVPARTRSKLLNTSRKRESSGKTGVGRTLKRR